MYKPCSIGPLIIIITFFLIIRIYKNVLLKVSHVDIKQTVRRRKKRRLMNLITRSELKME